MTAMYLSVAELAERWSMRDRKNVRERYLPQLSGVRKIGRIYRIPVNSVVEFERLHLCSMPSVVVSSPDLIKSKITEI